MFNDFKKRIKSGEVLLGSIVSMPLPGLAEILVDAGYDWIFVDTEHGPFGIEKTQQILQAAGPDFPCLVRLPQFSTGGIKKALDIGAAGIIIPGVNSAAEAQDIVSASKYPPQGIRGTGIGRAHRYGLRFKEYVEQANDSITVVIQAEHYKAVDNIEEIVGVEGLDVVFIGPFDLSASMGIPGDITNPRVTEAIEHVRKVCLANGMGLGIFGTSEEMLAGYANKKITLIAAGADVLFFSDAVKKNLDNLKDLIAKGNRNE